MTAKPRIRIRHGIWCCVTMSPFACGCGYTPGDAYDEWVRILFAPAEAAR